MGMWGGMQCRSALHWRDTGKALLVSLALAACTDQQIVEPTVALKAAPVRLDVVAGQNQTGRPGAQLPNPLVVRVVDAAGAAVSGQLVNFRVTVGGGTVFAGAAL